MDSSSSYPRRRRLSDLSEDGGDGLEEGEYVPGRDDDESSFGTGGEGEGEGGYRFEPRREPCGRRMSLPEEVRAPSCESDVTISDDGGDHCGSSAVSVPARRFACHVCGRRFFSPKAVDGHMRVHGSGRSVAAAPAPAPVLSGGWAATGRRGWTGGKASSAAASSQNSESTNHSSSAVVAVAARPLEPIPMAVAIPSLPSTPALSTRTNLSSEESSSASAQPVHHEPAVATTVVTGPSCPSSTTGAAVVHQQAAPPTPAEQARTLQLQPAVPPPAAQLVQVQPPPPPVAARPARPAREYSCNLCGKTYTSHQGLGGHAAGHSNRRKEAEAAAAAAGMMGEHGGAFLAAPHRARKSEKPHACQYCPKVFPTGVALGGHMRKHYTGPPIVHKKRRLLSEAELRLALSTITAQPSPLPSPAPAVALSTITAQPSPSPSPAPAVALSTITAQPWPSPAPAVALSTITAQPWPSPAPAVAGRLRLFGIDIGPKDGQAPSAEQQGSGAAEGSSSAGERQ